MKMQSVFFEVRVGTYFPSRPNMEEVTNNLRGMKGIILLKDYQASPARPSDKGSVEVKTFETGPVGIWFSELMSNCIIWGNNLVAMKPNGLIRSIDR
jgi:hypothetical protein